MNTATTAPPKTLLRTALAAGLVLATLAPAAARAAEETGCNPGNRPGATLLYPYFRVALDDPGGANTLVAVGNAGEEPVIAHVVLWTDWGIPTLAFDVWLRGLDLQTLSLRDVLRGRFPETGVSPPLFQCQVPVATPDLGPGELAALRAAHTGAPDGGGLCSGSGLGGPGVAVGYVTVDVMNGCTGEGTFPTGKGYFEHGGRGLAANHNVLWGDYTLVDPREDFAQGFEAVAIRADGKTYGPRSVFYGNYRTGAASDRAPLEALHRVRYVRGGGFDGGTELVVWAHPLELDPSPRRCGLPDPPSGITCDSWLSLRFHDEDGGLLDVRAVARLSLVTEALELGPGGIEPPADFGYVDVYHDFQPACIFTPPPRRPVQAWVAAVMKASGRYSVGLDASRPHQDCRDVAP